MSTATSAWDPYGSSATDPGAQQQQGSTQQQQQQRTNNPRAPSSATSSSRSSSSTQGGDRYAQAAERQRYVRPPASTPSFSSSSYGYGLGGPYQPRSAPAALTGGTYGDPFYPGYTRRIVDTSSLDPPPPESSFVLAGGTALAIALLLLWQQPSYVVSKHAKKVGKSKQVETNVRLGRIGLISASLGFVVYAWPWVSNRLYRKR